MDIPSIEAKGVVLRQTNLLAQITPCSLFHEALFLQNTGSFFYRDSS